ncbi:hypothetical protein BHE74_00044251, partial [Ensete ventricosum]
QSFNEWLEKAVILTKDEAEILKPSPSPSNPAPPTAVAASTTPKTDKESKPEEESKPQVRFRIPVPMRGSLLRSPPAREEGGVDGRSSSPGAGAVGAPGALPLLDPVVAGAAQVCSSGRAATELLPISAIRRIHSRKQIDGEGADAALADELPPCCQRVRQQIKSRGNLEMHTVRVKAMKSADLEETREERKQAESKQEKQPESSHFMRTKEGRRVGTSCGSSPELVMLS